MQDILISLENISVKINSSLILKDINLEGQRGDIIAIIGPNGSGKTTLLKTILGIYEPFEGKINLKTSQLGYVPQKLMFDRSIPITIEEMIHLYSGKEKKEITRVLEEVGLEKKSKKILGNLSGGQIQRVLIANALANNPELLLLDEATAGIDVKGEQGFYNLIHRIHKQREMCTIMISHDIHMVNIYATQIHCLDKTFVCHGTGSDVVKQKAYQELFGKEIGKYQHKCQP